MQKRFGNMHYPEKYHNEFEKYHIQSILLRNHVMFAMPQGLPITRDDLQDVSGKSLRKKICDIRSVPIVVGDEFCEGFFNFELGQSPEDCWRATVFRNYWDDSLMGKSDEENTLRPWHHGNGRMRYFPLGPRLEFDYVEPSSIKPSTGRRYLYNLMMSLNTSAERIHITEIVNDMMSDYSNGEVNESRVLPSLVDGFVGISEEPSLKHLAVNTSEYRQIMLDSVFTIAPVGHNPETFRLFEAAEAGSIPIVLNVSQSQTELGTCTAPYRPFMESNAPFIWINSWDELPSVLRSLAHREAHVLQLQARLGKWYADFMRKAVRLFEDTLHAHQRLGWLQATTIKRRISTSDDKDDFTLHRDEPMNTQTLDRLGTWGAGDSSPMVPLVTGCGRSGTHTVTKILNQYGIKAIHEGAEPQAVSVSWWYAPQGSFGPAIEKIPKIHMVDKRPMTWKQQGIWFGPVIQVVRHPLTHIESTVRCICAKGSIQNGNDFWNRASWDYASQFIALSDNMTKLERSARYWLDWNALVDRHATQVFRIEDYDGEALIASLGLKPRKPLPPDPIVKAATLKDSSDTVRRTLTWTMLRQELGSKFVIRLQDKARGYGYHIDE